MAMSQLNEEFDAFAQAKKLRKAMKGLLINKAAIIKVLGRRPSHQRVEIAKAFKTLYGKELVEKLKTKISGKFLDTCCNLCYDLREYDAMCLRAAVEYFSIPAPKFVGKKEQTLIDILTTRNNDQIKAIKTAYNTIYNRNLEEDIRCDVIGDLWGTLVSLKPVLLSLLTANRDETVNPDPEVVKNDVESLYNAGEKQFLADKSEFNRILCARSFKHVAAVADLYSKEYKESLLSVMDTKIMPQSSYQVCLNSIVSFATDPCVHFAEVIYKCVQGAGKNHKRLQHTIITQCEGDMQGIKNAMKRLHQKSLKKLVKKNRSGLFPGYYRKLLLTLIG